MGIWSYPWVKKLPRGTHGSVRGRLGDRIIWLNGYQVGGALRYRQRFASSNVHFVLSFSPMLQCLIPVSLQLPSCRSPPLNFSLTLSLDVLSIHLVAIGIVDLFIFYSISPGFNVSGSVLIRKKNIAIA